MSSFKNLVDSVKMILGSVFIGFILTYLAGKLVDTTMPYIGFMFAYGDAWGVDAYSDINALIYLLFTLFFAIPIAGFWNGIHRATERQRVVTGSEQIQQTEFLNFEDDF